MSATILVVEDEPTIQSLIEVNLRRAGHVVQLASDAESARRMVQEALPDLVLLDWMLPGMSGVDFARQLRGDARTRNLPIIMLTARAEERDKVEGLEVGADDYVTKPFSPRVLMARLRNVLRRAGIADEPTPTTDRMVMLDGKLIIDLDRHEVLCDGKKTDLTLTEFGILHYLASRPGFVRTRDQIISAVHGKSTVLSSRTVDVHITALRRKLGTLAECVETVRGVGYRFSEGAQEDE
jgi:two-component system phosphate regulon response regulator PhoB